MPADHQTYLERPYQEMYARAERMENMREYIVEHADEWECRHSYMAAKRTTSNSHDCGVCLSGDEVYYTHMADEHGGCSDCEQEYLEQLEEYAAERRAGI